MPWCLASPKPITHPANAYHINITSSRYLSQRARYFKTVQSCYLRREVYNQSIDEWPIIATTLLNLTPDGYLCVSFRMTIRVRSSLHELTGSTQSIAANDGDHHHPLNGHTDAGMAMSPSGNQLMRNHQQRAPSVDGGRGGGSGRGRDASPSGGHHRGMPMQLLTKHRNDRYCEQAQEYRKQNRRIGE